MEKVSEVVNKILRKELNLVLISLRSVPVLMLPTIMIVAGFLNMSYQIEKKPGFPVGITLLIASMFLSVFLICYKWIRSARFVVIGSYENEAAAKKIVVRLFKKRHGNYKVHKKKNSIGSDAGATLLSWGETMYVVFYKNTVYANSIGLLTPVTWGQNKKNLRWLKENYEELKQVS